MTEHAIYTLSWGLGWWGRWDLKSSFVGGEMDALVALTRMCEELALPVRAVILEVASPSRVGLDSLPAHVYLAWPRGTRVWFRGYIHD